jgi:hypothetical protein
LKEKDEMEKRENCRVLIPLKIPVGNFPSVNCDVIFCVGVFIAFSNFILVEPNSLD